MSLVGLDIGTTSCKGIVLSEKGVILGRAFEEYKLISTPEGFNELNAIDVWEKTQAILRSLVLSTKNDPIKALAVSAMGDTITPLSGDFTPLRNSILAFDTRSQEEALEIEHYFGQEKLFNITGMPIHPTCSATKILWIKRHQPKIYESTRYYLCYEDLILTLLGADPTTSYSTAARTMLFDIKKKCWQKDILDFCGINEKQLATPQPSGTMIGIINPHIAQQLGLSKNVKLITGGHDQACGAFGAGVVDENTLLDSTGTCEILFSVVDGVRQNQGLLKARMCVYPHVINGKYATFAYITTAGVLFKWFRDQFCQTEIRQAQDQSKNAYDLITAHFHNNPTNLFLFPYFSGSGTPWMDPTAMGSILGLSLSTDRFEIGQSILEGITFEIKTNIESMEASGIQIDQIRCIGGGVNSKYWMQLKANIIGKTIYASTISDVSPIGAALLAGVGCGIYKSTAEAAKILETHFTSFEPEDIHVAQFRSRYEEFISLRSTNYEL